MPVERTEPTPEATPVASAPTLLAILDTAPGLYLLKNSSPPP